MLNEGAAAAAGAAGAPAPVLDELFNFTTVRTSGRTSGRRRQRQRRRDGETKRANAARCAPDGDGFDASDHGRGRSNRADQPTASHTRGGGGYRT